MVNASHLKNRYAEDFLEKVFYFCIKKTGNITEAEDLSSDISLSVFTQLEKGNLPDAFDAWVWKIARNRYSRWAKLKHERSDSVSGADIDGFAIADEGSVDILNFFRLIYSNFIRRTKKRRNFILGSSP